MALATPAFAIVRPRVVTRTGESRLLEEVVDEILNDRGMGLVRICGGPGSGKTTALAHLAAIFFGDARIQFLDNPTPAELEPGFDDGLILVAMNSRSGANTELWLQPWSIDELIEYLLAEHREACGSVMERLGAAANSRWVPELASLVLKRFAANLSCVDSDEAIVQEIRSQLPTAKQQSAVAKACMFAQIGTIAEWEGALGKFAKLGVPTSVRRLLRHPSIQLSLASKHLVSELEGKPPGELERLWPAALVEEVGRRCRGSETALANLRSNIQAGRNESMQAMVASVLSVADPMWRPGLARVSWRFDGGVFCNAQWSGVNLFCAKLRRCDFTGAELSFANFEEAEAGAAIFVEANLRDSSMVKVNAYQADFRRASLERAKLAKATFGQSQLCDANFTEADLQRADLGAADLSRANAQRADLRRARLVMAKLDEADFTGSDLRGADLSGVDLRSVTLDDARLDGAVLNLVQWEDTHLANASLANASLAKAQLRGAHLTGTSFPAANLREADLRGAGLAEIEWENADLFGADLRESTFHMGSSRSGLVDSTIACEGSKTGFYTDDFEDMSFKRPEEIRKANLRGADLRGTLATGVDFYLVDLRDAKLDARLFAQARATGAILYDREP